MFADIKAAGYDGVEIPTFGGDPAHYAWLRGKLADEGLLATAVGLMPGEAYSLISDDPAARRAGAGHLEWLLECADALGAEVLCGPFHQALGVFTGRGPTEEELGRLVEAHQVMADKAPELTLAIEMLNRFECYVLTSNAQAAEHVAKVGRPNFGYLYDTFHSNIEERDPVGSLTDDLRGDPAHPHLGEPPRRSGNRAYRPCRGDPGGAGCRLRRLVHRRGLRAGAARPGGGDEDLAAAVRERGPGGQGRRAGDPRRLGELTRGERR